MLLKQLDSCAQGNEPLLLPHITGKNYPSVAHRPTHRATALNRSRKHVRKILQNISDGEPLEVGPPVLVHISLPGSRHSARPWEVSSEHGDRPGFAVRCFTRSRLAPGLGLSLLTLIWWRAGSTQASTPGRWFPCWPPPWGLPTASLN